MDKEELIEKICENMKREGYSGIDASTDISLLEYGLLCSDKPDEDGDYHFFYCIVHDEDDPKFDHGWLSEDDVNRILNETWFNKEKFLSFMEINPEDEEWEENWRETSIVSKVHSMIQYHGYENIFGSTYHEGLSLEDLANFKYKP